jgi:hypothetical protein
MVTHLQSATPSVVNSIFASNWKVIRDRLKLSFVCLHEILVEFSICDVISGGGRFWKAEPRMLIITEILSLIYQAPTRVFVIYALQNARKSFCVQ